MIQIVTIFKHSKMQKYVTIYTIILGIYLSCYVSCDLPPASPTINAAQPNIANSANPGALCTDDAAINSLYALIPDIINGCATIQTQIAQNAQLMPSASSQMVLILQNIQLQDMLSSCDMIIKTKQMADTLQAASVPPPPTGALTPAALPATTGDPANTSGNPQNSPPPNS